MGLAVCLKNCCGLGQKDLISGFIGKLEIRSCTHPTSRQFRTDFVYFFTIFKIASSVSLGLVALR